MGRRLFQLRTRCFYTAFEHHHKIEVDDDVSFHVSIVNSENTAIKRTVLLLSCLERAMTRHLKELESHCNTLVAVLETVNGTVDFAGFLKFENSAEPRNPMYHKSAGTAK